MLYFVCEIMLKLCVLNVKARLLYYKANLILSLSTCQRTRQNVFEYLLSNNLKIRKESPNSSLKEKPCLPYSSHTSHPPSKTPCLPRISFATQKLKLDSCQMVENSVKHSIRFCGIFFQF